MSLVFELIKDESTFFEPFQYLMDRIKLLDTMWYSDSRELNRCSSALGECPTAR